MTQLSRGLAASMPSGLSRYSQRKWVRAAEAAAAGMQASIEAAASRVAAMRRVGWDRSGGFFV